MKALAVLLLAAAPALAQEAWPPPLPRFEYHRASARPPEGAALDAKVLNPGLDMLQRFGPGGLGSEAGEISRWAAGRADVRLVERGGGAALVDGAGSAKPVSPAFGAALRHMNGYFGLTGPTLAHPISHEELAAAFLAPGAVDAVRAIFDRSIAERVSVGKTVSLPEVGGEATLDGTLSFHFNEDPDRPTLRRLIARRDDPAALARLFEDEPVSMGRIDAMGILKRHLATRARWDAEDKLPREKRDTVLRMAVDTVIESAAAHYSGDFGTQLKTMIADDWSGRYAGTWHCHPGDVGPNGWVDDYPPSEADYEAAAKSGQELVIVFLKDGFDVYELALTAGVVPFEKPAPISYRSPEWRAHFDAAFVRLSAAPAP